MIEPIIEVQQVTKRFKKFEAVKDVDLSIYPGEIFGLLGPNGAGKTTLVEMILGLKKTTNGSIAVFGFAPQNMRQEYREKIGIQLESTDLPFKSRIIEVFTLFRSFYKRPLDIDYLLDLLNLKEKRKAFMENLSKGMRQKVGIGLALIGNPEIIFLDEPTSGIDPIMRLELWDIFRQMKKKNKTVFMTTHYLEEAEKVCDRVGIMDKGRLIDLGKPQDLIKKIGFNQKVEIEIPKSEIDQTLIQDWSDNKQMNVSYGKNKISIFMNEPYAMIETLNKRINANAEIRLMRVSLEDVFFKTAGREYSHETNS